MVTGSLGTPGYSASKFTKLNVGIVAQQLFDRSTKVKVDLIAWSAEEARFFEISKSLFSCTMAAG